MTRQELIAVALAQRERAYAPYSNYAVGCALRTRGGNTYVGVNVENASYPLTLCAERGAIAAAVAAGETQLEEIVVATSSAPPAPPCGMCLQTIAEFVDDAAAAAIVLVNPQGQVRVFSLADLLPHRFLATALDG